MRILGTVLGIACLVGSYLGFNLYATSDVAGNFIFFPLFLGLSGFAIIGQSLFDAMTG